MTGLPPLPLAPLPELVATALPVKRQLNKRKRVRSSRTEWHESRSLAEWLQERGVLALHVPNEMMRASATTTWLAKLAGLKPGAPDWLIFRPPPRCPEARGVAIELKAQRREAKASASQLAWLADLESEGWLTRVCHGAPDAIEWLVDLGYGRMDPHWAWRCAHWRAQAQADEERRRERRRETQRLRAERKRAERAASAVAQSPTF